MNRILLSATLSLAAAPLVLHAADSLDNPNRFSLGARFGLNFKGSFRKNAAPATAINPGPALGGADHTYDDGSVRTDSSGTASGLTWNWSYKNPSQVVGDTMQFHASEPNPTFSPYHNKTTDDPQLGVELTYQRLIGPLGQSVHWGFEVGFSYTELDLQGNNIGVGRLSHTTDTYQLMVASCSSRGVLPPGAGFNGTFVGPGPLLGDTPTRSVQNETLSSRERLSGQLFNARLGPFVELKLSTQWSLAGSIGFTLAPAFVDYEYNETTTRPGAATLVERGHSSKSDLLYGPYAAATLRCDFSPQWGVYLGAQYQHLNSLEQSVAGRTARLEQDATIMWIAYIGGWSRGEWVGRRACEPKTATKRESSSRSGTMSFDTVFEEKLRTDT